jgi:hypothetical protein
MPCTVSKGEVETEFSSRQRKRSSSIFEQTKTFDAEFSPTVLVSLAYNDRIYPLHFLPLF